MLPRSFVASLALISGATQAAPNRDFSLGPTIGTLGIGGEVSYRPNRHLSIRGNAQGFALAGKDRAQAMGYKYKANWFTAGAMADYYPTGGNWHVSAGVYYNGNRVAYGNTAGSSLTIGSRKIAMPAKTVTGHGSYNRLAPYVGIGVAETLGDRFVVGFNLGALYQGRAAADAHASTLLMPKVRLNEVRDDVQHAMNRLRFYPVATVKVAYRF